VIFQFDFGKKSRKLLVCIPGKSRKLLVCLPGKSSNFTYRFEIRES